MQAAATPEPPARLRPWPALRVHGDGTGKTNLLVSAQAARPTTGLLQCPLQRNHLAIELHPGSTTDKAQPSAQIAAGTDPAPTGPPVQATPAIAAPSRAQRDAELAVLLHAAGQGSARAFEDFYDRTVGYASALARRMVRPDDLEDVLADAFFQAWREAPRFDVQRGSAVTWLLTLVRSRALDLLRRQRITAQNVAPEEAEDSASAQPGPDELLALARAGSSLHNALAALSTNERWVLGLAYFRDLTHRQIADCTGLPLGSVKSLILRSQARLREQLGSL